MGKENKLKVWEKALIDKELDLYRRENLLKIKEEIAEARQALVSDWSEIEHKYHSTRQDKEVELARLDALIEARKETRQTDDTIIQFLKGIIETLAKGQTDAKNH
jgi:chorismate mutase